MRTKFTALSLFVAILTATLALTGCPGPNLKLDLSRMFMTCLKSENDQKVSSEARQNELHIEDSIDAQDTQIIDCNGKQTQFFAKAPVKTFRSHVDVETPAAISNQDVGFVRFVNQRTCADFTEVNYYKQVTQNTVVSVTDSEQTIFNGGQVNVTNGANVITIQYFAKCPKFTPNTSEFDIKNCATPVPVIGQKDIILRVNIQHPIIPGTRVVKDCHTLPTEPAHTN